MAQADTAALKALYEQAIQQQNQSTDALLGQLGASAAAGTQRLTGATQGLMGGAPEGSLERVLAIPQAANQQLTQLAQTRGALSANRLMGEQATQSAALSNMTDFLRQSAEAQRQSEQARLQQQQLLGENERTKGQMALQAQQGQLELLKQQGTTQLELAKLQAQRESEERQARAAASAASSSSRSSSAASKAADKQTADFNKRADKAWEEYGQLRDRYNQGTLGEDQGLDDVMRYIEATYGIEAANEVRARAAHAYPAAASAARPNSANVFGAAIGGGMGSLLSRLTGR